MMTLNKARPITSPVHVNATLAQCVAKPMCLIDCPSTDTSSADRSQSTAECVPVQSGVETANSPSMAFAVWAASQTRPSSPLAMAGPKARMASVHSGTRDGRPQTPRGAPGSAACRSSPFNPFMTAVWTLSNARACYRANQSKTSEFARTVMKGLKEIPPTGRCRLSLLRRMLWRPRPEESSAGQLESTTAGDGNAHRHIKRGLALKFIW